MAENNIHICHIQELPARLMPKPMALLVMVVLKPTLLTVKNQYNIQGWIEGINKAYVNSTGTTNWFGEEVAYDNGYTANQINGNIAGVKWKTISNGIPRSYGFTFDKVIRLVQADFTQQNTTGDTWKSDKVNFSVKYLTYDANGNINGMRQEGMDGTKLISVDQLKYTYQGGTNKMTSVKDTAVTVSAKLGDFIDGSTSTNEYVYDGNGNVIVDYWKRRIIILMVRKWQQTQSSV